MTQEDERDAKTTRTEDELLHGRSNTKERGRSRKNGAKKHEIKRKTRPKSESHTDTWYG